MNYYEHHLGDYVKDTLYLTMLQDGAYRRLIDVYYIKEEPIPLDMRDAYQRARATSKAERDAVGMVLNEFFEKTPEGWRHGRCDEEIERYRQKQEAAPAKKENDRERQQRARDRRKALFTELRDHGVTAPWDATTSQLENALQLAKSHQNSQVNNGDVTPPVTPPVTRDNTATQSPVPSNHTKEEAAAANISNTVAPAKTEPPPSPPRDGCALELHVHFSVLIRQWEKTRGKASQVTSSDPRLSTWAEKGVTDAQLQEAYDLAVADRDHKQDPTAINAGFLDAFLAKVLNPPTGESALNRSSAPAGSKPWQATATGITARGAELGIVQGDDEIFPVFKIRVFEAAAMTDDEKERLRADHGVTV